MASEVTLAPTDGAELKREYETNLRHGRAFVRVIVDVELLGDVTLVITRPVDGGIHRCAARVVMKLEAGQMQGTALELTLTDADRSALTSFCAGEPMPQAESFESGERARSVAEDDLPDLGDFVPASAQDDAAEASSPEGDDDAEEADDDGPEDVGMKGPLARLRKLGAAERMRLARDGNLEERVLLERLYGKSLWEELLRNPQITVPEVARIAAKGTAPRILLEHIVDNAAWSRQSIVRRALLANPRVSPDGAQKLLRATAKNELKLIVQTAAYPAAIRASARKLLDA